MVPALRFDRDGLFAGAPGVAVACGQAALLSGQGKQHPAALGRSHYGHLVTVVRTGGTSPGLVFGIKIDRSGDFFRRPRA